MDIPHIVCKNCGIAKPWEAFTVPNGPNQGTALYACYECYLVSITENEQSTEDERLRRNTYARAYYRKRNQGKPRGPKKTPEQLLEARRQASRRQSEKLKEIAKLERIRKAIEMLEGYGFKVT